MKPFLSKVHVPSPGVSPTLIAATLIQRYKLSPQIKDLTTEAQQARIISAVEDLIEARAQFAAVTSTGSRPGSDNASGLANIESAKKKLAVTLDDVGIEEGIATRFVNRVDTNLRKAATKLASEHTKLDFERRHGGR